MAPRPRVVIVGAGFAGLYAAKGLRRAPVRITLVDRKNHHTFQPLLYQVATAALNASDIAVPVRRVFRRQHNVEVLMLEARRVDLERRTLVCQEEEIAYDILVLATGATHSYFGHDEWSRLAPGLKTVDDALEIRRRVLYAYELAELEEDDARRRALITFVVVGAGPTGVELAGALSEIARKALARDFRRVNPRDARVVLVEGAPRVLPTYVPPLSESAKRQLEALGVEVRTGARVTRIDRTGVSIGAERIEAHTVIWAAGVAASPIARTLGVPLDSAGRIPVNDDLTVPGHPEVYAVGDLAAVRQPDGSLVPGVAAAAIQEGRYVARAIERSLRGLPAEPFRYVDKGSLATIGRAAAVADMHRFRLTGLIAWLAWLLVHIFFLIGFKNRLIVLFEWALAYVTHERGARLIVGDVADLAATVEVTPKHAEPEEPPRRLYRRPAEADRAA